MSATDPGLRGPADAAASTVSSNGGDGARESIGRYLARQRKLRGIGIDELARLTRIPIRSLERLESGAFDHEPDGFARGFVRTVAKAIGLDADETVARMLDEPRLDSPVSFRGLWRVVVSLAALVALGLAALAGWSALQSEPVVVAAPAAPQGLPVRRDAVRALALEAGAIPGEPAPEVGEAPAAGVGLPDPPRPPAP